jgi:hypothetical protein
MEWLLPYLAPFVLGALAWPFVLWRRRVNRREAVKLSQLGSRVSALVTEVWRDGDGWNVTYKFTPGAGRAPVVRTEAIEDAINQPVGVGERVEVAHELTSPYYSRIVSTPKVSDAV